MRNIPCKGGSNPLIQAESCFTNFSRLYEVCGKDSVSFVMYENNLNTLFLYLF